MNWLIGFLVIFQWYCRSMTLCLMAGEKRQLRVRSSKLITAGTRVNQFRKAKLPLSIITTLERESSNMYMVIHIRRVLCMWLSMRKSGLFQTFFPKIQCYEFYRFFVWTVTYYVIICNTWKMTWIIPPTVRKGRGRKRRNGAASSTKWLPSVSALCTTSGDWWR